MLPAKTELSQQHVTLLVEPVSFSLFSSTPIRNSPNSNEAPHGEFQTTITVWQLVLGLMPNLLWKYRVHCASLMPVCTLFVHMCVCVWDRVVFFCYALSHHQDITSWHPLEWPPGSLPISISVNLCCCLTLLSLTVGSMKSMQDTTLTVDCYGLAAGYFNINVLHPRKLKQDTSPSAVHSVSLL